jgi:hypothetical protein
LADAQFDPKEERKRGHGNERELGEVSVNGRTNGFTRIKEGDENDINSLPQVRFDD